MRRFGGKVQCRLNIFAGKLRILSKQVVHTKISQTSDQDGDGDPRTLDTRLAMRFDVPTIGPNTIEKLAKHKAGGLAIEAGKTLIIEREKTLQLAKSNGIPVVGVEVAVT